MMQISQLLCPASIQDQLISCTILFEPHREKTGFRDFRPGPTKTGLYFHRRWLEACNFGFRKKRDCTICLAKTKALISCAVTAQLICVFVFAYAKSRFSHDAAHLDVQLLVCPLRNFRYLDST